MSSYLYALGQWAYRSRRLVVALWIVALTVVGGGAVLFSQGTDNSFSIPGTESQTALDALDRTFPQVSGSSAQVVIIAPDGESVDQTGIERAVGEAADAFGDIEGVAGVTDPFSGTVENVISEDGTAAVVTVQLDVSGSEVGEDLIDAINAEGELLAASLPEGSSVSVGGEAFSTSMPELTITEAIGLLVALVVLVLTFGSFVAAGLPLLNALLGVGITMAGIFLATTVTTISSTTPMLALMLGLAVGIDYALFIMSRHLDQLRAGMDPQESAGRAVATAGSAVVFAGLTVIIALAGLAVAGIPFLTVMGVAAAVGVGVAVLVALTLTPALLGMTSRRLERSIRRRDERRPAVRRAGRQGSVSARTQSTDAGGGRFYRGWVRAATRWPALTIALVVGGLGLTTIPALDLRLALPDAGSQAEGTQARDTYDILAERFGPGYNGPLIVTGSIISSTDPLGLMEDLRQEVAQLDGVAAVPLATPNATADTGIIQVIPEGAPDSEATKTLVQEIRDLAAALEEEYGVALSVTGFTAVGIDISDRLGAALLPFGILVVGLSLILLTMVFRSIWVPVKAAVGFLLSLGASMGVVAAVFEWGWFADLLNVPNTGPVISFMPIILMGVLFGLAMDYEVFLVARIREEYVHGGDARAAIEKGFLGSGKVVTAAAVIMFAVFASFVPEGDSNIKPIALGLAVGVFVDAFLVRMTLVPAVLQLLGERAWQMPRWLDRLLPSFDVEGEGLSRELALAGWPGDGVEYALAAEDLTLVTPGGVAYRGVSLRVPTGTVLVVEGSLPSGASALLLTLAGRTRQTSGLLKVAGFTMPERAAAVRGRVALARMAGESDPVDVIRAALRERPSILVIDDLDAVTDPRAQSALRHALTQAPDVTLVVGCTDQSAVQRILPPDRPRTVTTAERTVPEKIEAHA